jgi:acetyl-CoA carboxylase biotin carboxyl carrier protein
MNIKEIQDLIKFVAKAGVSEVEIEQKDFKIVIKTDDKSPRNEQQYIVQASAPVIAAPQAVAEVASAPVQQVSNSAENTNYITIKSPMIGTFYRSAGPDKDAFVSVGDSISQGDTVCIIEAMKLFNEIESEFTGRVVKVLVDDASPVEYDQPLLLIDPS